MALVIKDRVKQTTTTTGTGTLTLNGTIDGFQTFAAALSDGDTTYYALLEPSTNNWEVGLGTWTEGSSLLARTTVLASSNSGSAVNLTAQAEVFITQPAGKAAFFNAAGDLALNRDPQSSLQAATKQYVDTIAAAGIHYHAPVRVEHPSNLTATYNNGTAGVGATLTNSSTQAALVLDSITMVAADRVLIANQTNQAHNGVYTVTNIGSASTNWVLTRATDADSYGPSDSDALGEGDAFFIKEGNTNAGHLDVMTTSGTITFGTTNIVFSEVAETSIYSAGNGLTLIGTEFAADAGTGVTVDGSGINIGQAVETTSDVTFNSVAAALTGNVSGNVTGNVTGNADTATALQTARNIGGVSFDGTASINLPGVNATGNQDTTGNAATATAWETGRTISLTGDVTGTVTGVDGTGNASIATTIAANSVALGTDTTGDYVSTVTSGNYLTGGTTGEGSTPTLNVDATPTNTASKVVARDASGNFSAGAVTVTGLTTTGDITFGDNDKAIFGAGSDLQIFHDGNSKIEDVGTGNLEITTNGIIKLQKGSTEYMAQFNVDGAVQLYYDNAVKFASTSTGIDVTGNVTVSGTVDGRDVASDGSKLDGIAAGATNVTNNNQLTNGAGYTTFTANQSLDTTSSVSFGGVNINGGLNAVDNIYLAASIYHEGDTDTYLQFNAADTFRVVTNASQRLVVSNSGVGISNGGLDMNNNSITEVNNIYLANNLYHDGDTNTYLNFGTDTMTLLTGGSSRVLVNNTGVRLGDSGNGYFRPVTGTYGSIEIDGGAHGGWEGYNIGGWAAFMSNGSTSGIINDINNEWIIEGVHNGETRLYHNGVAKIRTDTSGALITGNLYTTGSVAEDYDALSGTSPTCNVDNAGAFSLTMSGNTTFTFSGADSGYSMGFILQLTGNGSTVTWPSSVKWAGGTAPDAPASGETDVLVFHTRDGGTNWYGVLSSDAAA